LPIDRRGVDRVDRHASIQQSGDEQAAIGLDDAGQVRGMRVHVADAAQEGDERGYSVGGVGHARRRCPLAHVVDDNGVMVIIRPIDTNKPHNVPSLSRGGPGRSLSLYGGA